MSNNNRPKTVVCEAILQPDRSGPAARIFRVGEQSTRPVAESSRRPKHWKVEIVLAKSEAPKEGIATRPEPVANRKKEAAEPPFAPAFAAQAVLASIGTAKKYWI
ncbi:MAG: hypothetical protein JNM60_09125 [Candidatus Competibacteraceae bacterium]|nr:hypothetical protein [Candidatus Competibacteraceae bacterium]